MNKDEQEIFITVPSTNIDGKPYQNLAEAIQAAEVKIGWGTQEIKIFRCKLTRIVKRGDTVIEVKDEMPREELPISGNGESI